VVAAVVHVQPVEAEREGGTDIGVPAVGEFHPGPGLVGQGEPRGVPGSGDDGRGKRVSGPGLPGRARRRGLRVA